MILFSLIFSVFAFSECRQMVDVDLIDKFVYSGKYTLDDLVCTGKDKTRCVCIDDKNLDNIVVKRIKPDVFELVEDEAAREAINLERIRVKRRIELKEKLKNKEATVEELNEAAYYFFFGE